MRLRGFLLALCLLASVEPVFGQPWREAYARQDYAAAARLLHTVVLERPAAEHEPDPEATEYLALLYANGRGLPADPVLACSMLRHASFSAAIRLGPDDATTSRLNRAWKAHCGTLGAEARAEADAMVGCYAFDVPSETFNLGPLHLVQTTRAGFRILEAGRVTDAEVSPFGCNRQLSMVRYAPVLAPSVAGTLVTRHFFELFHRTSVHRDGRPIRVLSWTLVEIVGSTAQHREHEILLETATAAWPPSCPSDALPSTVFTALADGRVNWRFSPSPNRSGTLAAVDR
jgi:hypothetical protein